MQLLQPAGIVPSFDTSFGIHDFAGGALFTNYPRAVRVSWIGRHDGDLVLPGYLQVDLLLYYPYVQIDGNVQLIARLGLDKLDNLTVREPVKLRLVLQPFFYPAAPPGSACDGCARRRLDETIHFVLADAELLRDDDSGLPPTVTGCDCGINDVADCYLQTCNSQEIGDREVDRLSEVTSALDDYLRDRFDDNSLRPVDDVLYYLTSDPLVGGAIMGRLDAVEDVADLPECSAAPPVPAIPNVSCGANPTAPSATDIEIADTLDAVFVTDGQGRVRGRDNPDRP